MQDINTLQADGSNAHLSQYLPALPSVAGGSVARLHFDSLADLAAYIPVRAPENLTQQSKRYWGTTGPNEREFFGPVDTMAQTLDLARNGWADGAERARPLLDRVKTSRPTARKLARYDVAGAVPSIPRYLAGNPLNMRSIARTATTKQPVITLICNVAAPSHVPHELFQNRAIAAAAIVDRLEDAGFRVEIISGRRESSERGEKNNKTGHRSEMFFRLKSAQDTLDLPRVCFGMGHPAALRRMLFGACDLHASYKASLGDFQGYAVSLASLDMPPGTYALPDLRTIENDMDKSRDPIKVFDYVLQFLTKQHCPGLE